MTVRCEACDGRRFQNRILAVRHRGKNMDDVLAMTVEDAMRFFSRRRADRAAASAADRRGARLRAARTADGDPLGGRGAALEARVLPGDPARVFPRGPVPLRRADDGPPCRATSSGCSGRSGVCSSRGHSILAIEHHLEFLAASDWIIDLGPGGGENGGRIVAEGSPDDLRRNPGSLTGRFLAEMGHPTPPETRRARGEASS